MGKPGPDPARRFPLLSEKGEPAGRTVSWAQAERAYEGYAKRYPASASGQDLERIAERGGFGPSEMDDYAPGWREAEPLCDRAECNRVARWRPILRVFAPLDYGEHPPARGTMDLAVCDSHKASIGVADLVTDEGWKLIAEGFAAIRRVPPERGRTVIEWERLNG